MLLKKFDLFNTPCDAVCISTNGYVFPNQEVAIASSSAAEAAKFIPDLSYRLATCVKISDHSVTMVTRRHNIDLYTFPTKPAWAIKSEDTIDPSFTTYHDMGSMFPGYAAKANLELIKESALQLRKIADTKGYQLVLLPDYHELAGGLDFFQEVKPLLDKILDDRFVVGDFI